MDFVTLQPGDVVNERYELLDKLGAGAFGAVFRARQLGIDRIVAIKCLLQEAGAVDETAIERFRREAKLSSALEHPNTITIHDYGRTEQGVLYLVMEYVRGMTLKRMLRKESRLEPERAIRIARQVLSSLQEAHSRGIVHRDMKPANIMLFNRVGERDVVKVLDFGIAKFVTNDGKAMGDAKDDLTVAGRIIGTPRYMAPEQINGQGAFPASDLYALGLILYEMLSGRQAVTGDSTLTLIAQQISDKPIVHHDDPLIPDLIRPILIKATHKKQMTRYQSAGDFMKALDEIDMAALAQWSPTASATNWKPVPAVSGQFPARGSASGETSGPRSGEFAGEEPTKPAMTPILNRSIPDIAEDFSANANANASADADPEPGGGSSKRLGMIAAVAILVLGLAGMVAYFVANNTGGPTGASAIASTTPDKDGTPKSKEDETPPGDEAKSNGADGAVGETNNATNGEDADEARNDGVGETNGETNGTNNDQPPDAREITIKSNPPGADVMRGEETLGKTPMVYNLAPDAEPPELTLNLTGYVSAKVEIAKADKDVIAISLKGIPSTQRPPNNNRANNRRAAANKVNSNAKVDKGGDKTDKGGKAGNGGGDPNEYTPF